MKPPTPTLLASGIRSFFSEHLPLTRGLSPNTVRSYRDTFVMLLRFLADRHLCAVVDLDLVHLDPEALLAFLQHLETDRGNGVATRNVRLAAVRSFARFVATRHPDHVEPCQRLLAVPTKRARIKAVEYLDADEIRAMIAAIDRDAREGPRDYAMLLTLFNTGARVQELLGLCPQDLQLERPYLVRLRGKGRKERVCPLWADTVESLRMYLADGQPITAWDAPIFRNRRGEPMTRFGVRYILRRYSERAATTLPRLGSKQVHPHMIRHSTAVHLLRSGVDIVTISHWLGHASIETTNRYIAVDLETKRSALERAEPIPGFSETNPACWRADASVLNWLESL